MEIIRLKIQLIQRLNRLLLNLVAKVEFMKMSTPHEKAQCVSWFIETMSDIAAQQSFRRKYGRKQPARPIIRAWHKKFMETGSVLFSLCKLVFCYRGDRGKF